jgi:hypothetical protein
LFNENEETSNFPLQRRVLGFHGRRLGMFAGIALILPEGASGHRRVPVIQFVPVFPSCFQVHARPMRPCPHVHSHARWSRSAVGVGMFGRRIGPPRSKFRSGCESPEHAPTDSRARSRASRRHDRSTTRRGRAVERVEMMSKVVERVLRAGPERTADHHAITRAVSISATSTTRRALLRRAIGTDATTIS